ncbi:Ltp family lipoprotein [Paenibacillus sp. Marseille-Q9583]
MKKPIYKKWWFWLVLILVIGWIGSLEDGKESTTLADPEPSAQAETVITKETEKPIATPNEEDKKIKEAAEKADAEKKDKEEADAKKAAEAAALEAKKKEESVPREHKSALKKAESYAETLNMSKAGIYDQLTSEYGANFPPEAAQYAIDNIVVDWKENALKSAQSYAETLDMSDSAIYDQLISDYGAQFTAEEAQYAIDNLK